MIEHIGNYVKISDRMIPAANIQVDGYPGWKTDPYGLEVWYGIYFEIAFEDGSLWTVDQNSEATMKADLPDDTICVATHDKFSMYKQDDIPDHAWLLDTWDEFLELYRRKLEYIQQLSITASHRMGVN